MSAMYCRSRSRRTDASALARVLAVGATLSLALGVMVLTSVINAAPASAHAALVKITPNPGAQLATAPQAVVLEFNEPISPTFATVVVTTAGGLTVARGKPTVRGATVTQPLSPGMTSGGYRVAFRVVSVDGHPVSGESKFTLSIAAATAPATPAGTPSASASGSASGSASPVASTPILPGTTEGPAAGSSAEPSAGPSRLLLPIAGAAGLLAIGAVALLRGRRRP